MTYTFVTIAHRADLPWVCLQAQSMQRYLPTTLAAEIMLVANGPSDEPSDWIDVARDAYGGLSSLVRVIRASDIAALPPNVSGWRSQQILKLMVARAIATDRYVALDAKNHCVFPLDRNVLECAGRLRSRLVDYAAHPLRAQCEHAMHYFGLEPQRHLRAFMPTITPFTLPVTAVCALLDHIEEREGRPFPAAFLRLDVTEFLLYGAFVTSSGTRDALYDLSGEPYPTIWEDVAKLGADEVARLVARCEERCLPFFGVHRRAVPHLTSQASDIIAGFWTRRQLFPTEADALRFLAERGGVETR